MKNKKHLAFISLLIVFCMSFSIIAYAGDFDLPIIDSPGNNASTQGATGGDGFTTPPVGGDEDPTNPTNPTNPTKPSSTTTTKKPTTTKAIKITVNPTKLIKLTKAKKALTVNYALVSGVTGYQIQLATNKKFTKNVKYVNVGKQNVATKKVKKLKAKKKYFVRVRAYKVVGGKTYYSNWSNVKNAKTK